MYHNGDEHLHPEDSTLSEISQSQKHKYSVCTCTRYLKSSNAQAAARGQRRGMGAVSWVQFEFHKMKRCSAAQECNFN